MKLSQIFKPSERDFFLVLGAGRSGTSLLSALIDFHPDLEMGLEQFSTVLLSQREKRFSAFETACLAEAKKHKHWGNKITTEQIHFQQAKEQKMVESVTREFCKSVIKKRKVIFIKREGPACIHSKMQRTGKSFEVASEKYRQSVQTLVELRQCCPSLFELKFENLLTDTQGCLKEVCDFLEVDFSEEMLRGYQNTKMPDSYQRQSIEKKTEKAYPDEWYETFKNELEITGYQ